MLRRLKAAAWVWKVAASASASWASRCWWSWPRANMLVSMARARLRRQLSSATDWAGWVSLGVSGLKLALRLLQKVSWGSQSSVGRRLMWPVRPWRRLLRLELDWPMAVFGPVDFCALRRFASSCFSETIIHLPDCIGADENRAGA